jgi:hypothetical protein
MATMIDRHGVSGAEIEYWTDSTDYHLQLS